MRTNISFQVAGKSQEEVEHKIKERVAAYLEVDVDSVEEKVDIEMFVTILEENIMELTFISDCRVKVKN
jgi:hypothetical protein